MSKAHEQLDSARYDRKSTMRTSAGEVVMILTAVSCEVDVDVFRPGSACALPHRAKSMSRAVYHTPRLRFCFPVFPGHYMMAKYFTEAHALVCGSMQPEA